MIKWEEARYVGQWEATANDFSLEIYSLMNDVSGNTFYTGFIYLDLTDSKRFLLKGVLAPFGGYFLTLKAAQKGVEDALNNIIDEQISMKLSYCQIQKYNPGKRKRGRPSKGKG